MKTFRLAIIAGAMALALVSTPARADFLDDLFGGSSAWMARAHGNLAAIAARYSGRGNFTGYHGPWCAVALSHWVEEATGRNPHILRARDFARFGRRSPIIPGAILVWPHHTGIYAGNGLTISGNGRGHRVHLGRHSLRGLIAVRAP